MTKNILFSIKLEVLYPEISVIRLILFSDINNNLLLIFIIIKSKSFYVLQQRWEMRIKFYDQFITALAFFWPNRDTRQSFQN